MTGEIEFEWDDENKKHLDAHKVAPAEFEQLLDNDPIDLTFERIDSEERYRSVGLTNGGRLLSVVWTIRNGKVRAISAFPASVSDRKASLQELAQNGCGAVVPRSLGGARRTLCALEKPK